MLMRKSEVNNRSSTNLAERVEKEKAKIRKKKAKDERRSSKRFNKRKKSLELGKEMYGDLSFDEFKLYYEKIEKRNGLLVSFLWSFFIVLFVVDITYQVAVASLAMAEYSRHLWIFVLAATPIGTVILALTCDDTFAFVGPLSNSPLQAEYYRRYHMEDKWVKKDFVDD